MSFIQQNTYRRLGEAPPYHTDLIAPNTCPSCSDYVFILLNIGTSFFHNIRIYPSLCPNTATSLSKVKLPILLLKYNAITSTTAVLVVPEQQLQLSISIFIIPATTSTAIYCVYTVVLYKIVTKVEQCL